MRRAAKLDVAACVASTAAIIKALGAVASPAELAALMSDLTSELGFRHYALIHHADLREPGPSLIDIKDYPQGATERIVHEGRYRRDPVIRACAFADCAFVWSDLDKLMELDRQDRACLAMGRSEGLNEGITVPCILLGDRMGSCTFAGLARPERARRLVGAVQIIGVFAFQAARRIILGPRAPSSRPRLHPRPRDCIILAGRGYSNKEIARALSLTPRTVDGYMTEARLLFDAHDRAELVVSAIFAGEIGLDELRCRHPSQRLGP